MTVPLRMVQGRCIHCQQVIDGNEIKSQARGDSIHGKMIDRLYCIVALQNRPKVKKDGTFDRYSTGDRKGMLKTTSVRYFRDPKYQGFRSQQISRAHSSGQMGSV